MKKLLLFAVLLTAGFYGIAQSIWYVNPTGTGAGTSWADASGDLQKMIYNAAANDQVWVAGGTYKPIYRADALLTPSPGDRNNAFVLQTDVKVYGGFAGTETTLAQRDLTLIPNKSTLSGDLNGHDGANFANNGDNAYHVVIAANAIGTAELNGFTVSGGNADLNSNITVNGQNVSQNQGGAINNSYASPIVTNVILSGNSAANGGGMYDLVANPVLTNIIISGNKAVTYGGGMDNYSSSPILTNVTLSGNVARYGGGMCNMTPLGSPNYYNPVLTNVTISGNYASASGGMGGMYNSPSSASSSVTINNSIIFNNNSGISSGGTITYKNSLVQGLAAGTGANMVTSANRNATDIFTNPSISTSVGTTGGDYSLKATSPVIDKGSNALYNSTTSTPQRDATTDKDLADNPRLYHTTIDIGAYEWLPFKPTAGIVYVKKGATGDGSSWTSAAGELADALVAAKTNTAIQQIWVAGGVYKPMYSPVDGNFGNSDADTHNNTFLLVNNVKVYGGFAGTETTLAQRDLTLIPNKSTLSGDLNGDDGANFANNGDNAYHVVIAANAIGTAELNGFTLSGGNANITNNITVNGQNVSQNQGGAINNLYASPIVTNVILSGNNADLDGGGMSNDHSSPVLTNVTISGNNAVKGDGGGMVNNSSSPVLTNVIISSNNTFFAGGGIANINSSPLLTNVIISGNATSYMNGGGMSNESNSSPILTNVTIIGNKSVSYGGGMSNYNSSPVLTNVTISGNTASNDGGGVYNYYSSSPTINNSIIYNNDTGIYNNDDDDDPSNPSNPVYQYSLIQDNPAGTGTNMVYYSGNASNIFTNFLTPGLSTGGDYTLKETSPALDHGSNNLYNVSPRNASNDKDLAGNARLSGTTIDMGAYELQQASTLPVTLVNFTAIAQGNKEALLQWESSTELNNKGYGIEMSATGYVYKKVGFVQGSGTTSVSRKYKTVVQNLVPGTYYFRLKITALDGNFTYSSIQVLTVTGGIEAMINIYPNPVADGNLYINIENTGNRKTTLRITGLLGQLIKQTEYSTVAAPIKIMLPDTKGAYYIEIITGDGKTFSKKILRL